MTDKSLSQCFKSVFELQGMLVLIIEDKLKKERGSHVLKPRILKGSQLCLRHLHCIRCAWKWWNGTICITSFLTFKQSKAKKSIYYVWNEGSCPKGAILKMMINVQIKNKLLISFLVLLYTAHCIDVISERLHKSE